MFLVEKELIIKKKPCLKYFSLEYLRSTSPSHEHPSDNETTTSSQGEEAIKIFLIWA